MSDSTRRLIDTFQRNLPLEERPYQRMAEALDMKEEDVIEILSRLSDTGVVSRIGPVIAPNRVGVSTLAAMSVPPENLLEVAALVNGFPEVNHNYERENEINLWFVVTAACEEQLKTVLNEISTSTGLTVLDLPLEEEFFIDLGFPVQWN